MDGEQGREHVLSFSEEVAYVNAAAPLLKALATIILDCGLRSDEVYRLQWDHNYRGGRLIVHTGKTRAARRSIPVTERLVGLLEIQRGLAAGAWIFPAPTKTGHIDESGVKKQHKRALKESKVSPFVPYDLRHTCLTRWAQYLPVHVKEVGRHESLETTMKYIHLNERDSEDRLIEAREKMQKAKSLGGGHSPEAHREEVSEEGDKSFICKDLWCARRGSNTD